MDSFSCCPAAGSSDEACHFAENDVVAAKVKGPASQERFHSKRAFTRAWPMEPLTVAV